jgi:hypothetical protein
MNLEWLYGALPKACRIKSLASYLVKGNC